MADPVLIKSLLGLVGAVVGVGVLTYAKGAFRGHASPVEEAQGHEVFRGEAQLAHRALDELAKAGIAAWIETAEDEAALMVDSDQAEQLPQLLALEQHLRQQRAAEADVAPSAAG